jgi:hypothetical protein
MGMGGEFALTVEGLTEKAISHWLFQVLAMRMTGALLLFKHILDNTRGVPAILIN